MVDLKIVGDDGKRLPEDGKNVGNLYIRGNTIAGGYYNNEEASKAAIDDEGYFGTGDVASIDEQGFLRLTDRAKDLAKAPALVLAAQQSGGHRSGATAENATDYVTSSFKPAVKYLYQQAGITADDIDVVQSYENFTGGVVMSLIEHGLCTYENADEVLTFDNLRADGGALPLNTSGGNLAECYMHGLGLQVEAVRQVRGESSNQVPDAKVALANAGPMVAVASTAIYGTEETLG